MNTKISSHYVLSLRFVFSALLTCWAMIIGNPMANATIVEPSAELELIGIFDGNNNNPTGLTTIANAIGLPEGEDLRDYIIGEAGSNGGTVNGFMVNPDTFKDGNEAIAGEWGFSPAESSFDNISHLVVKASNHYALYRVNYLEPLIESGAIQGLWTVDDLGKHALSHVTAYSLPQIPIPAAGLLFGSALLGLLGCQRKYRQ